MSLQKSLLTTTGNPLFEALSEKLTTILDEDWSARVFPDPDDSGLVNIVLEMLDHRVLIPLYVTDVDAVVQLVEDFFTRLGEFVEED